MSPITISRLVLALTQISDRDAEKLLQKRFEDLTALSRVIEKMREPVIAIRGRSILSASRAGIEALGLPHGKLSHSALYRDLLDFLSHPRGDERRAVTVNGEEGKKYSVSWSNVSTLDNKGALLVWLNPIVSEAESAALERAAALAAGLSKRETEVYMLLSRGRLNKQIAHELGIGVETVRTYVARTFKKLNVSGRIDAVNVLRNKANGAQ
ncbi:MAG TPA: LuxR C-terminal-related transcriptional regulator [Planctomycetota bacterium]|nr:LuxR C-terminal-related transcriptional regulator [Planctomycetota bacterium]